MKLEDKISAIPDFPKPGILFRHFGPILADPNAMAFMVEEFAKKINPSEVDVFVGIESRGFIIATALALHYKKPLIMIRKAGKLPGSTLKISYDIEYGSDTMEIEKDAIMQDQRVIMGPKCRNNMPGFGKSGMADILSSSFTSMHFL